MSAWDIIAKGGKVGGRKRTPRLASIDEDSPLLLLPHDREQLKGNGSGRPRHVKRGAATECVVPHLSLEEPAALERCALVRPRRWRQQTSTRVSIKT